MNQPCWWTWPGGAGIRTMSVTDHDTVAGLDEVERAANASGIDFVSGIEITAVHEGRDIPSVGYFIDRTDPALAEFLERARADRLRRLNKIADKLADIGKPIGREALDGGQTGGRIAWPSDCRESAGQGRPCGRHPSGVRAVHRSGENRRSFRAADRRLPK